MSSCSAAVPASAVLPTRRASGAGIQPATPARCGGSVVQLAEGFYQLSLAACAGQTLLGTQQVAWVQVATATNQSSAFVPLNPGRRRLPGERWQLVDQPADPSGPAGGGGQRTAARIRPAGRWAAGARALFPNRHGVSLVQGRAEVAMGLCWPTSCSARQPMMRPSASLTTWLRSVVSPAVLEAGSR